MRTPRRSTAPKIFLGPGEIAGYFCNLKSGFEKIGIECEHFVISENKYQYAESQYFIKGFINFSRRLSKKSLFGLYLSKFFQYISRISIFIYSIFKYDTFIFPGFGSFFKFYDLPLLKLLNKRVIVVMLGSDARPPIFSGRHVDDEGGFVDPALAYDETRRMVRQIRRIERYADYIINHTATVQFFTRTYIRFAAIGLPMALEGQEAKVSDGPATRIIHAPSRPIAKGTHFFRKAIEDLRLEGHDIEYVELIGVSNKQVIDEIGKCDFVLDELYSDTPLAMFAAEAAFFGKPAIVGSYYANEYYTHNPDEHNPPSEFVNPETVKYSISKMIVDKDYRAELGSSAQKFVKCHWAPDEVSRKFIRIINNDIPSDWISSPMNNGYIWGWGLSKDLWKDQIKKYVYQYKWGGFFFGINKNIIEKIENELSG
jgi:hypothetical protein